MASITLSYVASDELVAKELISLLARAGHVVNIAKHEEPAFRTRERAAYVMVVWSAAAVMSPDVYEDARAALKLGRLVQIVAGDLDAASIPAVFRAHPLIPNSDREQILRAVSEGREVRALFSIRGQFAAPTPGDGPTPNMRFPSEPSEAEATAPVEELPHDDDPRFAITGLPDDEPPPVVGPSPIPRHRSKLALKRAAGQLAHRVPEKMRVGETEVIEVRLGRENQVITVGLVGVGSVTVEDLPIVETMTIDLYGSPAAFRIAPQSRRTQLVMGSLIWDTAFDQERFGRWCWHVTPQKNGTHELTIKVSADLSDSRGVTTSEPYRDRVFTVRVRVNYGTATIRAAKWAATGAGTAILGAYTHEVWWPKLKAWLMGTGLLS